MERSIKCALHSQRDYLPNHEQPSILHNKLQVMTKQKDIKFAALELNSKNVQSVLSVDSWEPDCKQSALTSTKILRFPWINLHSLTCLKFIQEFLLLVQL